MSEITYPNETPSYREARKALLEAELALRNQIERVAAQRRNLPPGGIIKENYIFQEMVGGTVRDVDFSQLFEPGKDTLFLYNFMYAPDMNAACPMCTSLLDGIHGQVVHLKQRINIAVVAKHAPEVLVDFAATRGWSDFRLLSSANNTYNSDYHGEYNGRQTTNANVFVRNGDEIRHFWGSEMTFSPMIEGGNMRHLDLAWPLWNVLDMTPDGRGQWYPSLSYD
ncbi:DUF899 family protein [Fulvivirgaceae bacterium BMA12]|uniref:DUF899 family protein n=1 Tax=Agaribacillus aureus TaxID=3051825 RepID=A0ABT8LAY0_9BACT|nr:DUF899 family protein [Fulvivirgaceae bacterium BMA12]